MPIPLTRPSKLNGTELSARNRLPSSQRAKGSSQLIAAMKISVVNSACRCKRQFKNAFCLVEPMQRSVKDLLATRIMFGRMAHQQRGDAVTLDRA